VFKEYGGPETQELVDRPKPDPQPGELVVAVRAAAVNPVDWKFRAGYMKDFIPKELPAGLGQEVAGVVDALGEGVDGFSLGDEVFGGAVDGGYAEYARVAARMAAHKPAGVSFVDAATLTVAGATAHDGVDELELGPGETLLITGIGGGVGLFAFLGGTWFPITGGGLFVSFCQSLPSYWLVQAGHVGLGGRGTGDGRRSAQGRRQAHHRRRSCDRSPLRRHHGHPQPELRRAQAGSPAGCERGAEAVRLPRVPP